jgi:hypothetical protein
MNLSSDDNISETYPHLGGRMSSLVSLQAYFNKLTLQRLTFIEIAADKAFVKRAKEIISIASDHGFDVTKDKESLITLCTWSLPKTIKLKMENFNKMIDELAEKETAEAK